MMTVRGTLAIFAVLWIGACSRAHEADDGADPGPSDSMAADGPTCPRTCSAACQDGELTCLCGGYPGRCAGYVVHCPTGLRPPECGPSGSGVDCMSTLPGGGAESAICVRDTAPGRGDDTCVPGCTDSEDIGCYNYSGAGPCEDFVVECPTAGHAPECTDHSVRCVLPDGDLEKPICVPG